MDTFTPQQRARCMSRIRSKNTKPEVIVRKELSRMGYRYRLHVKKLPGRPDIVVGRKRLAILVNGCFWHQHEGCKRSVWPKTNVDYWNKKLENNMNKQKRDIAELNRLGWNVGIVWECQTKDINNANEVLESIINGCKNK